MDFLKSIKGGFVMLLLVVSEYNIEFAKKDAVLNWYIQTLQNKLNCLCLMF